MDENDDIPRITPILIREIRVTPCPFFEGVNTSSRSPTMNENNDIPRSTPILIRNIRVNPCPISKGVFLAIWLTGI